MSQQEKSFVGTAEQGITVDQCLQARDGRRISLPQVIEASDVVFALGQNFLYFAQALLGFLQKFAVGILQDHLPVFFLGAHRVRVVAIGLFHLLVVDVRDFQGSLGGFRHVRKEGAEILVLDFRLLESGGAAFGVPGISDGQLGAGDEFGIGIGVNQGLQRHACDVKAVVLHRVHGAVEQHLVRLFRAHIRERIADLLVGAGY